MPDEKLLFEAIMRGDLREVNGLTHKEQKEALRKHEELFKKKAQEATLRYSSNPTSENLLEELHWMQHYELIRKRNTDLGVW